MTKGQETQIEQATILLADIGALLKELHPERPARPLTLDMSLDRDLALDSLARMELVQRCERSFAVSLPEQAIVTAETPRDLLRAIATADRRGGTSLAPTIDLGPTAAEEIPAAAATLTEVLDWHVRTHPERPHIRLYADDGQDEIITYGDLRTRAGRVAQGLAARGVAPGESVVIMLPTGRGYFESFMGILFAGGVPVPIYPPGRPAQIEEHLRRHAAILDNALAGILITVAEAKPFSRLLAANVESLRAVVTLDELTAEDGDTPSPLVAGGDTAFLQYTSGSTGAPKGVVLSHDNLLANVRAMGTALKVTPDDVFVSWLPLYHDMGLIGAWLGSMAHSMPLIVMSPLAFLARPSRWLTAIDRYGGTISGAPNFAYEACLGRVSDDEIEGLDLSSWRIAFNGAEPVSVDTVERFAARFQAYGFDAAAMMPVYGLAEDAVGLTIPPLGRGPRIDHIDRNILTAAGRAEPAPPGAAGTMALVACGEPLPGHQIRIVDAAGRELPDRQEGQIEFKGPSATSGYYRNAAATARLFDGDWLKPEDLGYTVAGELFVTGREKDIIIRAGRNIFPVEFEDAVGALDGVQKGNVAVFGSADEASGTERLVVMAEVRRRGGEALEKLRGDITALAFELIGGPPDEISLVPPRTVPKTSSGKIRRRAAREIYESGKAGAAPRAPGLQVARLVVSGIRPAWRRAWRTFGALLYGLYAWAVLISVALPTWLMVVPVPIPAWSWALTRSALRLMKWLTATRLTVAGLENLPPPGAPVIVTSNHSSYLDGLVLILALNRRLAYVAKVELTANFVSNLFLRRLGTLFVERFDIARGLTGAGAAGAAVAKGRPVVYFPEGTFSRMAGLLPYRLGAFAAAAEAGVPVVPVAIRGTRAMLRAEHGLMRRGAVSVTIGEAIHRMKGGSDWDAAITLRDEVRRWTLRHCGEPDLALERSPLEDGPEAES